MKQAASPTTDIERPEAQYSPVPGYWDESALPDGYPRRHWRKLAVAIGRMGFRQFSRHWLSAQQLIQENGVTYNVSNDPMGQERPWPLDPVPLIIAQNEWTEIERAVVQRATLLNAMLTDIYGPQRILREKLMPPGLIYSNPRFLRQCMGIVPLGGVHLHTFAADMARSPDGQWWIISDRTQAPSGVGYTLENRLLSARTLPSVFSQCRVRQLGRFFEIKQRALLGQMSQIRSIAPRVVVLTPGPQSETYFEHSFIAGYWGFPLVEGADLTVRNDRVYLKTLSGLEQVDVSLRRLDDTYCDPLELRADSVLGVPGLVQAVRSGNVLLDNALGSDVVETPAHMAFLMGLCRELIGEELRMPSVATWWCGQPRELQYVIEHLDQLVIKPAFPSDGAPTLFPGLMSEAEREGLLAAIQSRPERFVAQERVALSTVPVRTEAGFAPRHMMLRVFAVWDGSSYAVMPGGLTRISKDDTSLVVSMQLGGGSKDTWVLSDAHEASAVPRPPHLEEATSTKATLPSRVADNLFWLGRYTERVEMNVRLMRALLPALSGEEDFGHAATLETAVHLLVGLGYMPAEDEEASIGEQRWRLQRLLTDMVYDPSRTAALGWNLREMRRVSWQLKERLSADTWRVLQHLEAEFSRAVPLNPEQRYMNQMNVLESAIITLSAFSGLLMENTTRGYGWYFLEIGRRMERALQMADLLEAAIVRAPAEIEPYLKVLLQIADSSITYRTRYLSLLRTDLVLELLLCDDTNPRSMAFQLNTLARETNQMLNKTGSNRHVAEMALAALPVDLLKDTQTAEICQRAETGRMAKLEALLEQIKADLGELSEILTAEYFTHLKASRLKASW